MFEYIIGSSITLIVLIIAIYLVRALYQFTLVLKKVGTMVDALNDELPPLLAEARGVTANVHAVTQLMKGGISEAAAAAGVIFNAKTAIQGYKTARQVFNWILKLMERKGKKL